MRKRTRSALALIVSLTLLPSCAQERVLVAEYGAMCAKVQPICTGPDDKFTEPTARQLLRNEYARESFCGKPPKCPKVKQEAKPTS